MVNFLGRSRLLKHAFSYHPTLGILRPKEQAAPAPHSYLSHGAKQPKTEPLKQGQEFPPLGWSPGSLVKSTCSCNEPRFGAEFTTVYNSTFRVSDIFFWILQALGLHLVHRHTCRYALIHFNYKKGFLPLKFLERYFGDRGNR